MAIWLLNLSPLWVPPQPAGAQAQVMSYSYYYRGVVADPIITHSKCTGLNAQCPFPSGQERAVSTTPVCAVFLETTSTLMLQNHRWPSPLKGGKMYRCHYYTWTATWTANCSEGCVLSGSPARADVLCGRCWTVDCQEVNHIFKDNELVFLLGQVCWLGCISGHLWKCIIFSDYNLI